MRLRLVRLICAGKTTAVFGTIRRFRCPLGPWNVCPVDRGHFCVDAGYISPGSPEDRPVEREVSDKELNAC